MKDYNTRIEKRKKKPLWRKLLFSIIMLGFVALLAGGGLFTYYASQAPPLEEEELKDPIASQILDMNGEVVASVGTKKRQLVNYEDIPSLVEDAVLATEDVRFYDHFGLDPKRLGGAVLSNITEGFGSEGASTLTQQVVKRSFLTSEKSLDRKSQEAWLAVKLEKEYSKEEIFEMYVNKIYYSDNIYGIATAADYYFDKSLEDLSLAQAALLAGMPQSPNSYNPYDHPKRAKERRNTVLALMEQHGKISHEEQMKASEIPITEGLVERSEGERTYLTGEKKYEAFVDIVISEVEALGDYNIYEDGLRIHTTLDPEAQNTMEKMLNNDDIIKFPKDKDGQPFQAGVTLLDTNSGAIRAVGGGRNYGKEAKRGFNFATDTDRQPGSVIKPILAYGPAIEFMQWSTAHIVEDEEFEYENGGKPKNWDGEFKGPMTIREALLGSRNIPAIKTFNEVGHKKAADFASNLGLNLEEPLHESAAIGGLSQGTNPLEVAGAYAAFGNGGTYNEPYAVTKIELRDGSIIEPDHESHQAMENYTAYMVTDMLKDVLEHPEGTGSQARIPGLPAAGKTGTTNYSEDTLEEYNIDERNAPDSWFAGYTTNYTAAVWTGYQERKNYLTPEERDTAEKIFKHLMEQVSKKSKTKDFEQPDSVVEVEIEDGTDPPKLASSFTPEEETSTELFVKGREPSEESRDFVPDLPAPSGLTTNYDRENEMVLLDWEYSQADNDDRKVSFKVTVSSDGQGSEPAGKTEEQELRIDGIKPGNEYTFTVTAIADDEQSDPASIVLQTEQQQPDGSTESENESADTSDSGSETNQENNSSNEDEQTSADDGEENTNQDGQDTADEEDAQQEQEANTSSEDDTSNQEENNEENTNDEEGSADDANQEASSEDSGQTDDSSSSNTGQTDESGQESNDNEDQSESGSDGNTSSEQSGNNETASGNEESSSNSDDQATSQTESDNSDTGNNQESDNSSANDDAGNGSSGDNTGNSSSSDGNSAEDNA
ncbi:PBP1A family penicillin-binding protein [Sediminibacillus albus]|uniref:Penicillin-binding protein 1A n=1 Tax=Sediminibacillus albus TaxID=407036 RepID=A0A1G8WX17_9BACI|nr:PBP1A family penicillin-binding protein [Sediminibacillus albus]SDJ82938.1 penicillin-binding protein 1A [Sediminibacillus albus]